MSEVAVKNIVEALPYKIKDIGLAKDGRNAIEISEKEIKLISPPLCFSIYISPFLFVSYAQFEQF